MPLTHELAAKLKRVGEWLAARGADALLLGSPPNVAWLACGGDMQRPDAPAGFVVWRERCFLLCSAADADRIRQEELRGLGIEIVPVETLGFAALVEAARRLAPAETVWVSDTPGTGLELDSGVDELRRTLLPDEIERLRKLGRDAAMALEEVAAECYRGILERDAAARVAAECVRRQMTPILVLAGADERLDLYPRPLPKAASAERALILSLLATRGGLHVALSRTICLMRPTTEFQERFDLLVNLAAHLHHEARAGDSLGSVVQRALQLESHPNLSLGGPIGYAPLEQEALPSSSWRLAAGQAIAWSLAMPGARCEDTILLGGGGSEVMTTNETWPHRTIQIGTHKREIPDLLLL